MLASIRADETEAQFVSAGGNEFAFAAVSEGTKLVMAPSVGYEGQRARVRS